MKYELCSVERYFPCIEFNANVTYSPIRRFTVLEWIVMNAVNESLKNPHIRGMSIDEIFKKIYNITNCDKLLYSTVSSLHNKGLIAINGNELSYTRLKLSKFSLTDSGKRAFGRNAIISKVMTNYERVVYNLISKTISEDYNRSNSSSKGATLLENDDQVDYDFVSNQIIKALNGGYLFSEKYEKLHNEAIEVNLEDAISRQELNKVRIYFEDDSIISDYNNSPEINRMVLEELSEKKYGDAGKKILLSEDFIKANNIYVGDVLTSKIDEFVMDSNFVFASGAFYKNAAKYNKKAFANKTIFVFDKNSKFNILRTGAAVEIHLPFDMAEKETALIDVNMNSISLVEAVSKFNGENIALYAGIKQQISNIDYIDYISGNIISSDDITCLALFYVPGLPLFNIDFETTLISKMSAFDSLSQRVKAYMSIYEKLTVFPSDSENIYSHLIKIINSCSIASFEEAVEITQLIFLSFSFIRNSKQKCLEILMNILAQTTFINSYEEIKYFYELFLGKSIHDGSIFKESNEYITTHIYTSNVLKELFAYLTDDTKDKLPTYSRYEHIFNDVKQFVTFADRQINSLNWTDENDSVSVKNDIISSQFAKEIISGIKNINIYNEELRELNKDYELLNDSDSWFSYNYQMLEEIANMFIGEATGDFKNLYVVDTNILIEHPDFLEYFDENEKIILPDIIISELDKIKENWNGKYNNIVKEARLVIKNIDKENQKSNSKLMPGTIYEDLIAGISLNNLSPDAKILSTALYYIMFSPILLSNDNNFRNLAWSKSIKAINWNEFIKTHSAENSEEKNIDSDSKEAETIVVVKNDRETFMNSELSQIYRDFGIAQSIITHLKSKNIKKCSEFLQLGDAEIKAIFKAKKNFIQFAVKARDDLRDHLSALEK